MNKFLTTDFINWIQFQGHRLEKAYPSNNEREVLYSRLVKLMEETGELANAVGSHFKQQRSEKYINDVESIISNECADVIITTLLIGLKLNLNIDLAIAKKVELIDERFSKFN